MLALRLRGGGRDFSTSAAMMAFPLMGDRDGAPTPAPAGRRKIAAALRFDTLKNARAVAFEARQQLLRLTFFRHPSYPQYVSGLDLAACAFLNLLCRLDRADPVAAQNLRHIGLRQAKMLGEFASG